MRNTFALFLPIALLWSSAGASGQTTPAAPYTVYANGSPTSFEAMIEALSQADVVFVGEQHDHQQGHALELEILKALAAKQPKQALSLEMFERDVQPILDEYLVGYITESAFLAAARPWPNYKTDYRPLVEFCREKGLPVVAANAPRRYVNIVSRKGQEALQALPKSAKGWLPALPFSMEVPADYDKQLSQIFQQQHNDAGQSRSTSATMPAMPSPENMKQAQFLWDEAMKDSIVRFLRRQRGYKVVQMNGSMHSDSGFGIVARLRKAEPRRKVQIVTIRPDAEYPNITPSKYVGLADFVLVTPAPPVKK